MLNKYINMTKLFGFFFIQLFGMADRFNLIALATKYLQYITQNIKCTSKQYFINYTITVQIFKYSEQYSSNYCKTKKKKSL